MLQGFSYVRVRWLVIFSFIVSALVVAMVWAQASSAQTTPPIYNVAISKVTADSATLVIETDTSIVGPLTVYYGSSSNPTYASTPASGQPIISGTTDLYHYEVPLTGISYSPSASSDVYYRVVDSASNVIVPEKKFHTARKSGESFNYAVVSDSQPGGEELGGSMRPTWNILLGQMIAEQPDLILHAGDMVVVANTAVYNNWDCPRCHENDTLSQIVSRYTAFFTPTMQLTATAPLYAAIGNHEEIGMADGLSAFNQEFALPTNGSTGNDAEEYYSFDSGDTHFIVLNTEIPEDIPDVTPARSQVGLITGPQLTWLQNDLSAQANSAEKKWIVVTMHTPLFVNVEITDDWYCWSNPDPNSYGYINRATVHGLFKQYGVNVVFQGDQHHYERHVEDGVNYVKTGGGSSSDCWADPDSPPVHFDGDKWSCTLEHLKVEETKDSMTVTAIELDGDVPDTFTLTRAASATVQISDNPSGGDCAQIGTWDNTAKSCTLKGDVFVGDFIGAGISLTSDYVTLDGAGHRVTGNHVYSAQQYRTGIVADGRTNVTVKNVNVSGFFNGIFMMNNPTDSNNHITGNTAIGNDFGIWMSSSNGNTIEGNTASGNLCIGMGSYLSSNNTFSNNTIAANPTGLQFYGGGGSYAHRNSFVNNETSAALEGGSTGNYFSQDLPIEDGNYWSNYSCTDANNDGFCDSAYVSGDIVDNHPYKAALDREAPVVYSVKPADQATSPQTRIAAFYTDAGPSSGISSVSLKLDGATLTGCDIKSAATPSGGVSGSISCPASGLHPGQTYLISGSVSDSAGHTTPISGSFQIARTFQTITIIRNFGGECDQIGTWDNLTKTCKLKDDIYVGGQDAIVLDDDGITLDGDGHHLVGNNDFGAQHTGVLASGRDNVTVKGLTVEGFFMGIHVTNPSNGGNLITGNTATNNHFGIWMSSSGGNRLEDNTATGNLQVGIGGYDASNNTIQDNISTSNPQGMQLIQNSKFNTVRHNTLANNAEGLHLYWGSVNNSIYNNSFLNNTLQAVADDTSTANTYSQPLPTGGNFWSGWTSPDANSDAIVDSPFVFTGGQDGLPWTSQGVWPPLPPLDPPTLGGFTSGAGENWQNNTYQMWVDAYNNGALSNATAVSNYSTSGSTLNVEAKLTSLNNYFGFVGFHFHRAPGAAGSSKHIGVYMYDNYVELRRAAPGVQSSVVDSAPGVFHRQGGHRYTIRVEQRGENIKVFIDNQAVIDCTSPDNLSYGSADYTNLGGLAFRAYGVAANFEELKAWN